MGKHYITANELLLDSFRLAETVYQSGFRPSFIAGVWRGGTPVGIAVQEFLQFMGVHADHIAIRTSSYFGIDRQNVDVKVYGLNYIIDNARPADNLLIVDDVFDSGRSIQAIVDEIEHKAGENTPRIIKVACPWYKPTRNVTLRIPDFYIHATEDWLVFPHELNGLDLQEIQAGKGREVAEIVRRNLGNEK